MRHASGAIRNRWGAVGGIARDFAVVGGATIVGQGALILAAPLLARLYDPAAFGLLSVFAAVLSILVAVASLRFELAIPIATNADEAVHLFVLSVLISLASSVIVAGAVLLWGPELADMLGEAGLASVLWLLPIALALACFTQAVASWAVYTKAFSSLGRMRVAQGIAQSGFQLAFGVLQLGAIGLVLGDVASRFVGVGQLTRSTFRSLRSTVISRTSLRRSAGERWAFARVMTAASLLSAVSLQIPFLMIPPFFGLELAGQVFLAFRLLSLPASLVAAAVGQVFFGEASSRRSDARRLHELTRAAAVSLLTFSIPTYLIVLVAGQAVIMLIFGQQWELAGLYAQILAPSLIFWSVANPMSSLPLIGRRERESLIFTAGELALKAISLGIGAALNSLTLGIVLLSITSIAIEATAMWQFLRIASVGLTDLARPVGRTIARTVPFLAVVMIAAVTIPAAVPFVAAIAWFGALSLSLRGSPEARALMSGHL